MATKTKKDLEEEIKRLKDEKEELDRIGLVYKNLRYNFNLVVESILGEDYYNMGMDTYTCDKLTCEDLIRARRIVVFKDKTKIDKKDLLDIISDLNFKSIDQDTIRIDEVVKELTKLLKEY